MLCGKGLVRTQDLGYQVQRYDHCATCPVPGEVGGGGYTGHGVCLCRVAPHGTHNQGCSPTLIESSLKQASTVVWAPLGSVWPLYGGASLFHGVCNNNLCNNNLSLLNHNPLNAGLLAVFFSPMQHYQCYITPLPRLNFLEDSLEDSIFEQVLSL